MAFWREGSITFPRGISQICLESGLTQWPTEFRYFGLDDEAKALIVQACAGAPWVELAPLDKGLSGSTVLMARWSVSDALSKFQLSNLEILTSLSASMMLSTMWRHP